MSVYRKIVVFVILLFSAACCNAQLLETGSWSTFEGKIGTKQSQLSLYQFKDGTIKGNYVIKNSSDRVLVNGKLKANAVLLSEKKNTNLVFKGNIFTDKDDKYEGTYTDSLNNRSESFSFKLSTITWGDYQHRYTDLFGNDEEIESFMKQVKTAILIGDKQWVAAHIQYPIKEVLNSGYTSIKNQIQLKKYYNQIFTQKFKDKIRDTYTTNLFSKNSEVMLGNGEIWIGNTGNSTEKKYGFIITAINL
jgi:hypothetical protein